MSRSEVITVDPATQTLAAAVASSHDGDVIVALPGVHALGFAARARHLTLRSFDPNNPRIVAATILSNAPITLIEGSDFEISGVTMRNGRGDGAAIVVRDSSLRLRRCMLRDNAAPDIGGRGGALYYDNASYIHERNVFQHNQADWAGSAVYALNSAGWLDGDTYLDNFTLDVPGAYQSSIVADGGSISVRRSYFEGEGLVARRMITAVISGNTFMGSDSIHETIGLVVYDTSAPALIESNIIVGRGGLYGGLGSSGEGGAIIEGNVITGCLQGVGVNHGPNILRNNLVYDNQQGILYTSWPGSSIDVQYCLFSNFFNDMYRYVVGPFWGEHNQFQIDPGVVARGTWDDRGTPDDPYDDIYTPGDVHLVRGSPCIDAGDPDLHFDPSARDLDGQVRTAGPRADIGADEFPAPGDLDGDGVLSPADIDAFVLALLDRAVHAQLYPLADADLAGDVNGDGVMDNSDIDPFVQLLVP